MKAIKLTLLTFTFLLYGFLNSSSAQWVQVSNEMGNYVTVYSLAANANTIFAGTRGAVYKSTNNGASWDSTFLDYRNVTSLAVNGNNIFAGTGVCGHQWCEGGVYLSTNNGTTWTQTSLGNLSVFSLAIDGNNVFAGGYYGVYLSIDNGTRWTQTLDNQSVWSLAISGNNVFAGTYSYGVYKSTDNGTSWNQTSLNNQYVNALAVNGNNVFAGTGNGVYVSNDNGTTWTQRNERLGSLYVRALCISNNFVFAGTDSSVYRRPLGDLVGIQPISGQLPAHFELSQNYPNPFNPKTIINFQLSMFNYVKLIVYDLLGREIAVLVNEELKPGSYEVDFDGSNYPSGVYFYKLTAGDFIETKKMMLVK